MQNHDLIFIIPIITAFLWRFKGMSHPWGTQVNRLVSWVLPVGLIALYAAYAYRFPLWTSAASAALTWAGVTIGHSKWQNDSVRSYWGMCWVTCLRLFLTLLPFAWLDLRVILLAAFGLLAWPACWLGYELDDYGLQLSTFGFTWCNPRAGSEWEEFLIGLLPYGIAFTMLLLP